MDDLAPLLARVTGFFLGLTVVGLALGFALERALPHRRIWRDPLPPGQYRHEAIGNGVFLAVTITTFTAALALDLVRFGAPSWPRHLITFGALFLGFQAYYYGLHRALHHPALVRFHRWHHASRITTPLSGQSTSLVEAVGWMGGYVGLPLAYSLVVPISAEGWAAYVAYNVVGNIVGHANVEPISPAPALRARSTLATVFTYHALHHLRWTGHYGFASAGMDRLFGSEWSDWPALYARVVRGESMSMAESKRVSQ